MCVRYVQCMLPLHKAPSLGTRSLAGAARSHSWTIGPGRGRHQIWSAGRHCCCGGAYLCSTQAHSVQLYCAAAIILRSVWRWVAEFPRAALPATLYVAIMASARAHQPQLHECSSDTVSDSSDGMDLMGRGAEDEYDSDTSGSGSTISEVQVDFGVYDPAEKDWGAVRHLLSRMLPPDDELWAPGALADIVTAQASVGSLVKVENSADDDAVYGLVTAMPWQPYSVRSCKAGGDGNDSGSGASARAMPAGCGRCRRMRG